MCGLATHERPPFRAAGLAPAACYTSALRAVCQELRGCTGLALLGKHAVIGHELFACFDLFCEYAGRDCGVEDDLLVCHDGFLLAFVVVLAVIT